MKALFLSGIVRAPFEGPIKRLTDAGYNISILLEESSLSDSLYPELADTCSVVELGMARQSRAERVSNLLRLMAKAALLNPRKLARLISLLETPTTKRLLNNWVVQAHYLEALRDLGNEFDILHSRDGVLGVRVAQLQTAGFISGGHVCSFHGLDVLELPDTLARKRYSLLFSTASALTVQTKYMRNRLIELGAPSEKVHVIPSAVDTSVIPFRGARVPREGECVRLVSIGRLLDWKGQDVLIDALRIMVEDGANVHLDIIGDGPTKSFLKAQVMKDNLAAFVRFHGAQPYGRTLELLNNAHIFVHSPRTLSNGATEAMGLVMLEAQLAGLPCVVTNAGGVPETVVAGESAFVVPEDEPATFAKAVLRMIEEKDTWNERIYVGRHFVERTYSVESVTSAYRNLYSTF